MKAIALKVWQIWVTALGVVVVTAALLAFGLWWVLQPAQSTQVGTRAFIVPKNQSARQIGERLEEAGLVRNKFMFAVVVRWLGLSSKLQAGTFQLSPSWSPSRIAQQMTQGTNDTWVKITEGWRREEIAEYLAAQEDLTDFDETEFLKLTAGQEGRLFPDSYLVPRQVTAEGMQAILTVTFDKKVVQGLSEELKASKMSLNQVITLASIIEREAANADQRRLVSGVLHNRLEIGMPLQVDATLQYVKGSASNWWDEALIVDKQLKSPFNTYLNAGLPPAPISNPSLDAIEAALQPKASDYLYYLHADGEMYLAKTLAEHNANVQKYLR